MFKTPIAAALAVSLLSTTAHAQEAPFEPSPEAVRRPLDLRLPMVAIEPTPHPDLFTAKAVRNTGIVLTVAGTIATIAGTAALASYTYGQGFGLSYTDTIGLGAGGMAGGAVGIGVGAGMWAKGNLDIARAEGRAPALTPAYRLRRGHGMTVAGGVLTGIGAVLTIASLAIAFAPVSCDNGDDFCGIGNLIGGGITAGIASTFLASGIPLLAVGVSETRKGQPLITIDSLGPRSMPNGGGFGIGGRF